MSKISSSFVFLMPLFGLLAMPPEAIKEKFTSRGIASVEQSLVKEDHFPKYTARSAKVDPNKLFIDSDIDLECLTEKGEALRYKIFTERKEYRVDLLDKVAVDKQKKRLQELVIAMVELEADVKNLKEKKAWVEGGEKIALSTVRELKTTLESLLQDELENDFIVLKDQYEKEKLLAKKQLEKSDEIEKIEAVEENDFICDLQEKNNTLTKQVENLISQQNSIMNSMLGMNQLMMQTNLLQQMAILNYVSGPLVTPAQTYPYVATHGAGQWVYYPNGSEARVQEANKHLGEQPIQQQLGQVQMHSPIYNHLMNIPYQEYDYRYSLPQPILPGSFGNDPFLFNFGTTEFNQIPLQA
jgi:hypothetical protein